VNEIAKKKKKIPGFKKMFSLLPGLAEIFNLTDALKKSANKMFKKSKNKEM
jgi:hypothetical protein